MTVKQQIMAAYAAQGKEVLAGKGGFFVRGVGFRSLAQARKDTGITERIRAEAQPRIAPYGDYAWIAKINRIK